MTDDDIKAARALCDAATPAPWENHGRSVRDASQSIAEWLIHDDAAFIAAARTLVPTLLDELESARRDTAIAHQDASQLSGDANYALRELKKRMFAKIERYERDAEALTADLAATKAALAEATERAEVQARQRAEDAAVMARQAGTVIAQRAALEEVMTMLDGLDAADFREPEWTFLSDKVAALKSKVQP